MILVWLTVTTRYYTNFDNAGANTYFLKSNNYLRLKNIEIGYNLPSEIW